MVIDIHLFKDDNKIDIKELKYLLFAYEGDELDKFRIESEMKLIDSKGHGFITRT